MYENYGLIDHVIHVIDHVLVGHELPNIRNAFPANEMKKL